MHLDCLWGPPSLLPNRYCDPFHITYQFWSVCLSVI